MYSDQRERNEHIFKFCHEQESERRVSCEALFYWSDLLHSRSMPAADEVDLDAVSEELRRYMFLMTAGNGGGHYVIVKAGSALADSGGMGAVGISLMEAFPSPLNERAMECCENAINARQPMVDSGILILENDSELIYRMIMMPLSPDDSAVDHILGAFSFRRKD